MSHQKLKATTTSLEPSHSLRADFTDVTLRHSLTAKRRAQTKQHIRTFFKEPFSMKSFRFMRTAPGAVLAAAIVMTTGASAYALTNWFNGSVAVTQHHTVLSVDLSACHGNLPAGVNSTDRHHVQFEILGKPHISASDLQAKLLVECEYQAVMNFYHKQPTLANSDLFSGTITGVSGQSIGLAYHWAGAAQQKEFTTTPGFTVYSEGTATTLNNLHVGDHVVFVAQNQNTMEGTDPLASSSAVQSVFKTQYDTSDAMSASKNGFYQDNNIMPLDLYQQLNK